MTDLLWQPPHRPCNIETCAIWREDDGLCPDDASGICPATDDIPAPIYLYGLRPHVEARLTIPPNYGMGQDEAGPSLPDGIQIGWLSPVDHDSGDVALPPASPGPESDTGRPGLERLAGNLHATLCEASGCRFNYSVPACDS